MHQGESFPADFDTGQRAEQHSGFYAGGRLLS